MPSEAGGTGAHGAVECRDGLLLAAYAQAEVGGEAGDARVVLAGQLGQRHAGPLADHLGHQAWADLMADQALVALGFAQQGLHLVQLPFQLAELLGIRFLILARGGELAAQLQQLFGHVALGHPQGLQQGGLAVDLGQAFLQLLELLIANQQSGVPIPLQGRQLARLFSGFAAQAFQRLGGGGEADAHPGAGGVQHVHGLVRQLAAGQVAGGQLGGSHHRVVAQVDAVALLVDRCQAAQDGHRLADARFMQLHRLEAPGQRRILLEVLLVFAPGGGSDGAQLAARQRRLEQVGGVRAAGLATGADQGVRLVDEQDDRPRRGLHPVDHSLQTAFELALDAGAGLQQAEVQAAQLDAAQRLRHLAGDDAQGQALDQRGLADPGLADHDGVVLPPAGEDVDHLAQCGVAAQHRVELAGAGLGGEVVGEARQRRFAARRRLAGCAGGLLAEGVVAQAFGVEPGQQRLVAGAGVAQGIAQQGEEQGGLVDLALPQIQAGGEQGVLQPLHQFAGEHRVARFAGLATRLQHAAQLAGIHAGILQGAQQQAVGTLQQAEQQVFHQDLAAGAGDTALGGAFQVAAGFGIERLYQLLQVDIDHCIGP